MHVEKSDEREQTIDGSFRTSKSGEWSAFHGETPPANHPQNQFWSRESGSQVLRPNRSEECYEHGLFQAKDKRFVLELPLLANL